MTNRQIIAQMAQAYLEALMKRDPKVREAFERFCQQEQAKER